MRVTDKHVCFWNEWPSNWHPAEFDIEVNEVHCHFYNTEHEKSEGEDYEDVEDFYGWELS